MTDTSSDLRKVLEKRRKKLESARTKREPPKGILDCYRRASPHLDPPHHLEPYVALLDRAAFTGDVAAVFSAPPQVGKTEASAHAYALVGCVRPGLRHAYSTFSRERAIKVRTRVQRVCYEMGLDPHVSGGLMTLSGGTEVKFGGCSTGDLTGQPVDGLHIIDDPIKDRIEAMSPTIRNARWDWFHDVAMTRTHPGASTLVMMTRWSVDDLSGRILREMGWPYIRIAAICDSEDDPLGRAVGEPLWPKRRPLEWWEQFQRNAVTWQSMYQGRPRASGDHVFRDAHFYAALPDGPKSVFQRGYGCDLAYTAKTRADYSVLLRARVYPHPEPGEMPWLYLIGMLRQQVQADVFTPRMKAWVEREPGPVYWYGNSVERGVAQLIRQQIPSFRFELATADKYVRALPTAEDLWNPGRVLLPEHDPDGWVRQFLEELEDFTGVDDTHDDQVDALAALGRMVLKRHKSTMSCSGLNAEIGAAWRAKGGLRLVSA